MRHLLSLVGVTPSELEQIFKISEDLKAKCRDGVREPLLPGRMMALVFEKPSLRTRVSFETAIGHLGGSSIYLGEDAGFGKREPIPDFAKVLSGYMDVIVARTFSHESIELLAEHSQCAVVNGLSDKSHPCQALADLLTLREHVGKLHGLTFAYIGDGNNVAKSLALACGKVGMKFVIGCPEDYKLDDDFLQLHKNEVPDAELVTTHDPREAVKDAVVVYTDVWASMGQEEETKKRAIYFADFQVNAALMKEAPKDSVFMHCLPAHRGEEVTAEVIDGPQSVVFDEAENRLHAQKGMLAWLLASQAGK